jgi:hypothetical protein
MRPTGAVAIPSPLNGLRTKSRCEKTSILARVRGEAVPGMGQSLVLISLGASVIRRRCGSGETRSVWAPLSLTPALPLNRKEDRLLTPTLSSFEEEREKRGARRFRGALREISSRRVLSRLRGEGGAPGMVRERLRCKSCVGSGALGQNNLLIIF